MEHLGRSCISNGIRYRHRDKRSWLDYFRPGFHPWDHDNRAFLDQIGELVAPVAISSLAA